MLKIKILIIIFCCIGVVKAQTVIPPSSETPPGWIYYDGDIWFPKSGATHL